MDRQPHHKSEDVAPPGRSVQLSVVRLRERHLLGGLRGVFASSRACPDQSVP
jgi:hypothetical protein